MPDALNWFFGTEYFAREFIFGGSLVGTDSYFALIAPRCFSAYGTFMLRQFFLSVPRELEEAAYLDGCGSFGVLRHVVFPMSKPALATLAIFTFMWAWGDFFWPLIVTRSDSIKTLPLLLQTFQGQYGAKWNLLMAASVMGFLPMVVAFLLGQRQFIEGIKMGAVKG
jgi:multiple sugar transport system permease protein